MDPFCGIRAIFGNRKISIVVIEKIVGGNCEVMLASGRERSSRRIGMLAAQMHLDGRELRLLGDFRNVAICTCHEYSHSFDVRRQLLDNLPCLLTDDFSRTLLKEDKPKRVSPGINRG